VIPLIPSASSLPSFHRATDIEAITQGLRLDVAVVGGWGSMPNVT
jgi:hypothetical protein